MFRVGGTDEDSWGGVQECGADSSDLFGGLAAGVDYFGYAFASGATSVQDGVFVQVSDLAGA
jgi:hypothetical protein